jgi:hypothetical protein
MNGPKPEEHYTAEQRLVMLDQMDRVAANFYSAAVKIQNHPFLEFCGLMTEYIKMCRQAHAAGLDFTNLNQHSGHALPMQPFNARYLGEKIGCIYGPSLQKAENGQPFLEALGLPLPQGFDVTDPEMDAPDGAIVDGYHRVGDRWKPFAP